MGKTVPQLDKRVVDLTRDWEWKKQESFALVFGFFCFRILIFTDFIQSPIIFFWQRDLANPRLATDFPSPVP
jgi:hypothetical protein